MVICTLPKIVHAAPAVLTSPVPVVTGSQYGKDLSLGLRRGHNTDEDTPAWRDEASHHSHFVYLAPSGKKLLVAAMVNDNPNIIGCSGATPICRLEFRVSENNGLTWTQALEGSTPYLPIARGPNVNDAKFDYTLYVGPNEQDIWVSYVYSTTASSYDSGQVFTRSKIKKLVFNGTTKKTWTLGAASEPLLTCDGTLEKHCVGITGVAVQTLSNGTTERVWGITSNTRLVPSEFNANRNFKIVYTDAFSNSATWQYSNQLPSIRYNDDSDAIVRFGSAPRFVFFPIGNKKIPALLYTKPKRIEKCTVQDPTGTQYPEGIALRMLNFEDSTSWFLYPNGGYTTLIDAFPLYYNTHSNPTNCSGGVYTPANPSAVLLPNSEPLITASEGIYPMTFAVASMPTGDFTSRMIIAYEGGVTPTDANNFAKLFVTSCTLTADDGLDTGTLPTYNCPAAQNNKEIGGVYTSPSVGFFEGKAWVAAKGLGQGNSRLALFSENLGSSPWSWTLETQFTTTYDVASPAVPSYIPAGAVTLKSNAIPTIWSHMGGSRVAYGENSGGSTIGTLPKVTSNPVHGYGWASNFGWVSLNCINKPAQDCTNLFGTGIGGVATGADLTDVPVLAPSTATTFPIGGFGWSSNAGFLSFERRDSINNCHDTLANCNDANALTDDNDFGNPPGLPYNNYAPATPATIVSVAGVNQVNITSGTCSDFPDGSYVAISDVPATKPIHFAYISTCNLGSGFVDIHTTPNSTYSNGTTGLRMYKVSANIPLAKYDTSTQHVYGWGRFLNLCNFDVALQRCKDKDAGWVRLRGYYTAGAGMSDTFGYTAGNPTILLDDGTAFTSGSGVAQIGSETFRFTCSGFCSTLTILEAGGLKNSYGQTTVYNVTGKEYGLDAFWTGDHYEFAGWAWSNDYGWIRFNPLIFIGFSWLETLFGNVYSGENIQLPNAEDLNGNRFATCDVNGDGVATDPCYVSTYRIDAVGVIDPLLTFAGTGQPVNGPGSAAGNISAGSGTCGSGANEIYCKLQGDTTALQSYLSRNGVANVRFPTVGTTTASYRNALGKLDVSGLTTIVSQYAGHCENKVNPSKSYTCYYPLDKNRFGNMVYKTDLVGNNPVNWDLTELAGWKNGNWTNTETPILPLNSLVPAQTNEKAPLRSQVVHVQGDLTIDGGDAQWSSTAGNLDSGATGTITVSGVTGTMPSSTVNIPSTTLKASCSGCALVANPGGSNEEYFSYTGYAANVFSGVRRIKACGGSCPSHSAGEKIRFVWRLPYVDNGTADLAQSATIVVDGDLKINYNIIAADPKNDADISGSSALSNIRDLPTVAFVVKGNVTIDPQVNKLVAAFIVTSRDSTQTPNTPACGTQYAGNCGGLFQTGNDNISTICSAASPKCRPLSITGLLFAREFNFQRIGNLQDNQHPGEQVIADERLFLNPPPGMEDVTKALPNPQRTLP